MKKIKHGLLILLTLSIIVITVSSCGSKSNDEAESEAQAAFSSAIEAFKSGDVEQIKSLSLSPDTISDDTELRSLILSSLNNITYDIKSATASDGKNVIINVDITMIDSSKVMEKYIENIVSLVSSPEYQSNLSSMSREEYQNIMNQELQKVLTNGEIPNVTKNIDVNMRFDNGSWKINGSELTDLLISNTIDAISQIRQ